LNYFDQIYHILVDARHLSNVKTQRGVNTDSDNHLTIARIKDGIFNPRKEYGDCAKNLTVIE
jgi:hypothetical protein